MTHNVLSRLRKLEERAPSDWIFLCRTPGGEEKEVTAAEYQDNIELVFIRGVRGFCWKDLTRLVEGNRKRAAAIVGKGADDE